MWSRNPQAFNPWVGETCHEINHSSFILLKALLLGAYNKISKHSSGNMNDVASGAGEGNSGKKWICQWDGENASKNVELKIKWNRKNPMISSDKRILNSHLCLEIRVKEVLNLPQMKIKLPKNEATTFKLRVKHSIMASKVRCVHSDYARQSIHPLELDLYISLSCSSKILILEAQNMHSMCSVIQKYIKGSLQFPNTKVKCQLPLITLYI